MEHVGGLEHAEIRKGVVPGTEGEREKGELKRKREKTKCESEEERKARRKV